ncbi:MAG: alpha/beta hydrolase [Cellulosilyticaceae bacterium]
MGKVLKNKKLIIGVLATLVLLFVGITYIVGQMVYAETVGYVSEHFQDTDVDYVYQNMPEVIASYEAYETEDLMIPSENGYEVEAKMLFAKEPVDKTVVVVHGIGMNMWRHLREAMMYLENGFNVVIYNQRNTGETGGDNRSFGHYEKHDLAAVMNYVSTQYPDQLLGAHGFSMGAGTVGMYSGLDIAQEQADFLILDCPYDSMEGAVRVGIAAEGVPIPTSYAVWAGKVYNQLKSGFSYDEVDLTKEVAKSTMPMYIIHGEEDAVCTVDMGQAVYDAKESGYKEIWIEPETAHVRIYDDHPDKYEANVMAFIQKVQEQ